MPRLHIVAIVAAMALSLGCTADDDTGPPETMRDFCWAFVKPYCARMDDCADLEFSITWCEDVFMDVCCQDAGVCDQPAPPLAEEIWFQCIDDVDYLSCDAIEAGEVPDVCDSL